jgi:hypothetical protein
MEVDVVTETHKSENHISDEEWGRRFVAEGVRRGVSEDDATQLLRSVAMSAWRQDGFEDDPEGAIEEEFTYWEDDGDE